MRCALGVLEGLSLWRVRTPGPKGAWSKKGASCTLWFGPAGDAAPVENDRTAPRYVGKLAVLSGTTSVYA